MLGFQDRNFFLYRVHPDRPIGNLKKYLDHCNELLKGTINVDCPLVFVEDIIPMIGDGAIWVQFTYEETVNACYGAIDKIGESVHEMYNLIMFKTVVEVPTYVNRVVDRYYILGHRVAGSDWCCFSPSYVPEEDDVSLAREIENILSHKLEDAVNNRNFMLPQILQECRDAEESLDDEEPLDDISRATSRKPLKPLKEIAKILSFPIDERENDNWILAKNVPGVGTAHLRNQRSSANDRYYLNDEKIFKKNVLGSILGRDPQGRIWWQWEKGDQKVFYLKESLPQPVTKSKKRKQKK